MTREQTGGGGQPGRPGGAIRVDYALEPDLGVEEFIDVLRRSTLAERRPVEDRDVMERMVRGAGVVVTARHQGRLVGVARALTDFAYCTYLSELAVDVAYQRQGIGRELLRRAHAAAGRHTMLILLAAPQAATYYPHIGMESHPSCWTVPADRRRASAGGSGTPAGDGE